MTGVSSVLPTVAVRAATEADVPALVMLGMAFLRESSYAAHVAENPVQAEKAVRYLLDHPDGVVLVAERYDVVIGMIGLMVVPHLFSGELTAGEVFWYVDPTHRGSTGLRLLHAAEDWARSQRAVNQQMIAPTDRVGQLYERLGYAPLETVWQKRLES